MNKSLVKVLSTFFFINIFGSGEQWKHVDKRRAASSLTVCEAEPGTIDTLFLLLIYMCFYWWCISQDGVTKHVQKASQTWQW